ncbi:hypothetical protein THAOC_10285 [Thalassiosira oceanica]|uniref:J domain-containing protein n=1 Tax=Thalassiosira oceanica TaxID=159749 RepID=K0TDC2_THAOC|nr:hypothetical protein THAOC_10285 [Thalassiosira oceanica]|eukprot:EJK68522.1 hypothetical protein THAOC_10285 [Thalassiosira oceanica]
MQWQNRPLLSTYEPKNKTKTQKRTKSWYPYGDANDEFIMAAASSDLQILIQKEANRQPTRVLKLGLDDATEMDVKTAYRMLALRYHLDKNDPERTGMNHDQATAHFQLLSTANSYLRSSWHPSFGESSLRSVIWRVCARLEISIGKVGWLIRSTHHHVDSRQKSKARLSEGCLASVGRRRLLA